MIRRPGAGPMRASVPNLDTTRAGWLPSHYPMTGHWFGKRTHSEGRLIVSDLHFSEADERQARRAAVGSFVGAVIDWYDFILYGLIAALVFNSEFFPNVSPRSEERR